MTYKLKGLLSLLLLTVFLLPCGIACAEDATESSFTIYYEETDDELMNAVLSRYFLTSPVSRVNLKAVSHDTLYDMLENGTEGDLFLIEDNKVDLPRLIGEGKIAPLTSETLATQLTGMYSIFQNVVTQDDTLYAYPVRLLPKIWTVRTDLLTLYSGYLGENVPTTMNEYLTQMTRWYDSDATVSGEYAFTTVNEPDTLLEDTATALIMAYLQEYYTGNQYRDFNVPAFADTARQLSFLVTAQRTMETAWNQNAWGDKKASLYSVTGFTPITIPLDENEQYMLTPAFDEDGTPAIHAFLQIMVVRNGSQYAEAAEHFIEVYSQYLMENEAYSYELYENTATLADFGLTEDQLTAYQELLPHFDLHSNNMIHALLFGEENAADIVALWLNGNTSAEDALTRLDTMQKNAIYHPTK